MTTQETIEFILSRLTDIFVDLNLNTPALPEMEVRRLRQNIKYWVKHLNALYDLEEKEGGRQNENK